MQPIGWVSNLVVDFEGMRTHDEFDVIEFVKGEGSYPTLLGVGWASDSMEVIKFKKQMMTFGNQYIRVIVPMDPDEGRRYIEPVKLSRGGIIPTISQNIIFTPWLTEKLVGATLVPCLLILRMPWKIDKVACMMCPLGAAN